MHKETVCQHFKTPSLDALEKFIQNDVPTLDYVVSHDNLMESCKTLLVKVMPTWRLCDVDFVQCKDGITNKLVKCTDKHSGITVLIRAYGKKSELIIDRLAELANFVTLSEAGLSPPLYARFTNGFAYGYVEGRVFTVPDMSNPKLSSLVATKVAHWHKLHLPGGEQPRLFLTLWKWFNGIPKKYAVKETQANFETNVNLAKLRGEIEKLESILTGLNSPVVFCHNDLLSGNIIYEEHREDVSFIDFEYGCGNYRGYDIGNHFCKDQQLVWLRTYWKGFYGTEPTPLELEDFYLEVNLFALASHLYWGLWGLVQALFSDIPFDYMSYAVMRFKEYERTKELWFNLYATNNRD